MQESNSNFVQIGSTLNFWGLFLGIVVSVTQISDFQLPFKLSAIQYGKLLQTRQWWEW